LINFTSLNPINGTGTAGAFNLSVLITELNIANVTIAFNGTNYNYDFVNNASNFALNTLGNYNFTAQLGPLGALDRIYYNLTITDKANQKNTTETRLITGNQPPSLVSLSQSPATNDSLDPGVEVYINATLLDNQNNFESAWLEWKNSSQSWGEANRTKMTTNLSTQYVFVNSSFVLPSYESIINYRIYANDSVGGEDNLTTYTIYSYWDCTWNVITTGVGYYLGSTGGFYQDRYLGNVTIVNTGDSAYSINNCTIGFARNPSGSSWYSGTSYYSTGGQYLNLSLAYYLNGGTGLIYKYNGSSVNSLNISVSTNKTLELSGNFPLLTSVSTLSEYPFFIIASNINNTETNTNNVTITFRMVITPGAYLETGFENSSQIVYLTPGNFTVTNYVRNLVDSVDNPQNNTAYQVILNTTIPSQLNSSFVSGNLNQTIELVNTTNKYYNNLTFSLTQSSMAELTVGAYTFYSYSQGYENSSGNLSLINHGGNKTLLNNSGTINFVCSTINDSICPSACTYLQNITNYYDPDCSATVSNGNTGASSGGGGSAGGTAGTKIEKSEEKFELVRGQEQEFTFEVKNKYQTNMNNVRITVSGINSEYIIIEPNQFISIPPGDSKQVKVKINAPAYFTGNKYTLIFDILADLEVNGTSSVNSLDERKSVYLYIVEFSGLEALKYVNESISFLEEMNKSGMKTGEAQALLDKINQLYNDVLFGELKTQYEALKKLHDSAFEAKKLLEELKAEIAQKKKEGISVIETEKMLTIAEVIYNRGDYISALEKLKQAQLVYTAEVKGEFNLAYAIKNNPLQALGIIILAGILGTSSTLAIRYRLLKRKLAMLKEEEILLLELMKVIQRECFENNKMSMEEYGQAMSQYETKLSMTIEDKIETETKIANILKVKGKKIALEEEKKRLLELIKKVQDEYLNKGKLETRIYENMIKSYTSRLSEIQEKIAFADAKDALARQNLFDKIIRKVFKKEKHIIN
jgi:hypothetical protein